MGLLDVERRTFDADGTREQPWSSGERVLIDVAASSWDTGRVDLGYIASGVGGRHFQAVIDALAVRAGHSFASTAHSAIQRVLGDDRPRSEVLTRSPARKGLSGPRLPRVPGRPPGGFER